LFASPCSASFSSGDVSSETDAFFEKIEQGDVSGVEAAIAKGQDVNVKNKKGVSPLFALARKISSDMREKREAFSKANPGVASWDFYYEISSRDVEIAGLLIDAGTAMKEKDARGHMQTALGAYILLGPEIVELLLNAGADPNECGQGEMLPLRGSVVTLRLAPQRRLRTTELLLAAGADVNKKDSDGETALSSAALFAFTLPPETERRLVEMLIGAGADVNAANERKFTPLMQWAMSGGAEAIRLLLDAGADVNARDRGGSTALMMALSNPRRDSLQTVEMLIERGADVHVRDETGMTLLHLAATLGKASETALLLELGLNAGDKWGGMTPLHLATGFAARETEHNKGTFEERKKRSLEGMFPVSRHGEAQERVDFLATVQALAEAGAELNVKSGKDFEDPLGTR
jgi:hypothetical protein